MSVNLAFSYIEDKVSKRGFTQWEEPFDKENIASSIIDRSFHVYFNSSSRESQGNQSLTMRHSFDISLFFKGYRETKEHSHELLNEAENVILSLCSYNNNWPSIKSVQFQKLELVPFDEQQNDNIIVAIISIDIILSVCLNN